MRQIVLDTETTGLEHAAGHRVIEVACVELIDRQATGKSFHSYLNPQREIDERAQQVHGITLDFLADKPYFQDIAAQLLHFIRDAELIIHNAPFDIGFINQELKRASKHYGQINDYCRIFDTLVFAKKLYPGQKNNLDALCKRYQVDNSQRDLHGALLDAQILTEVYLAMTGGQTSLFTDEKTSLQINASQSTESLVQRRKAQLPILSANETELLAHQARIAAIAQQSGVNLWE
ncbi:DNA polymerase III subunit epsilon [soil metagenome]